MGDGPARPKKRPGDSDEDIGLLGKLTCRESRDGRLEKTPAAGMYMQQVL